MPRRKKDGYAWVHVFEEGTFGGRVRILSLGQRVATRKVGSLIVGLKVSAVIVDARGREIVTLPQRKVVPDFRNFRSRKNAAFLQVMAT
jgi:hypothetical protein